MVLVLCLAPVSCVGNNTPGDQTTDPVDTTTASVTTDATESSGDTGTSVPSDGTATSGDTGTSAPSDSTATSGDTGTSVPSDGTASGIDTPPSDQPNDTTAGSGATTPHVHVEEILPAVVPTCTQKGLTEGKRCSACGEILVAQTELPYVHSYGADNKCSLCGKEKATEGLAYKLKEDGTYEVSGLGTATDTNIIIPSTHENKPVTSVGPYAFYKCAEISTLVIPDSVKSIGDSAFSHCSGLMSVDIGDGVTTIGGDAFWMCNSIMNLTVGKKVTTIGRYAFEGCSNLFVINNKSSLVFTIGSTDYEDIAYYAKAITNADGTTKYKNDIEFSYHDTDDGLRFAYEAGKYTLIAYLGEEDTVTLPLTVNGQSYTIYQMRRAKNVIIPDGFVKINDEAFYDCTTLISITFPNGIESIGDRAFNGCENLKSINIPASVTEIGRYSNPFDGCESVTTITVDQGNPVYHASGNCLIETETKTLIAGCSSSIIPSDGSVTVIGISSFSTIHNLESIVIPEGIVSIDGHAFSNCFDLANITLPQSLQSIGRWAFYGCEITSITIPAGVTFIDESPFGACEELETIIVEAGNTKYKGIGNCLIDIESKKLISGGHDGVIPNDGSVEIIGENAFGSFHSLSDMVIPDGVTTICSSAFHWSSLKNITIPSSVTKIEINAFFDAYALESIIFKGTKAQWKAIEKGAGWNGATGEYVVHCTDGDISKADS